MKPYRFLAGLGIQGAGVEQWGTRAHDFALATDVGSARGQLVQGDSITTPIRELDRDYSVDALRCRSSGHDAQRRVRLETGPRGIAGGWMKKFCMMRTASSSERSDGIAR